MAEDPDGDTASVATNDSASTALADVGSHSAVSGPRLARLVGVVTTVVMSGAACWFGYTAWQGRQAEQQRDLYVQVARQIATDLTTIRHEDAEADVQRILDASTGAFHDEFLNRRKAFVDRIRQDQSNSHGVVTEAGLESMSGSSAQVLVSVAVKLSTADVTEKQLDGFRLRMQVQRAGDQAKVSDVEYVQ